MSPPAPSPTKAPISSTKDANLTTHDQEKKQQLEEQQNLPQSHDPQSPKSLTLEIPNPQDSQVDDLNKGNPDEIAPLSPTISDSHVSSPTIPSSISRRGGGGGRRKKRRVVQGRRKRIELLAGTLNPIPFAPVKTVDFSSHEALLRRLGLWDFVRLQFDSNLRADLIAQLIANFNYPSRCSYVNGFRIKVTRPDLARALQLPVKRDKADNALEAKETEESIDFIVELVSTWFLLHEESWTMPDEVNNTMNMIKDGNFEKVEWSTLMWLMVEKELTASNLGNCYYASHLQILMKSQKDELFKEEPDKMEIDVKDDEEEEDVKNSEELPGGSELVEHKIELSLSGPDNAVKDDGEKEREERLGNEDAMDCEESKEVEEQGQWPKNSTDGHFLRSCDLGEIGAVKCEEERKQEEVVEDEAKEFEDGEEVEEEREEEMGFAISPKGDGLEVASPENPISAIEAQQVPFDSGLQIRDDVNVSSGDFLASSGDAQTMPGGSSFFGDGDGSKREIEHLENDMPHHALNGSNKRMRSDGHWDMRPATDFDMCMEQMQLFIGKTRMLYEAKEQACQELNMQQQLLIGELEQRGNMVHHLQKARMDDQQKRQMETYRLERELFMMENLLEGYRKALKETTKAFAEYRKKCPLPEEPIYKDTGSGGLVLSTAELEKQRLKQEEENRQNRLLIEKKVKEFEAGCITKFEAYADDVELLINKLQHIEKEGNLLKELVAKRKVVPEMTECAPSEE